MAPTVQQALECDVNEHVLGVQRVALALIGAIWTLIVTVKRREKA